jgi:hypothetical protein
MQTVVSIVPRLPPAIDGVGDYALSLADSLYKTFGTVSHFIVCDPDWKGESHINRFPIYTLQDRTVVELNHALEKLKKGKLIVLLHLSGYGYAKWAICHWLLKGLQVWKNANPDTFLVTMFHELYNSMGWPWQHNFWVSHSQRRIAQQFAQLTDRCITNCQEYALSLSMLSQGKHQSIPFCPVVSNVGEPKSVLPIIERIPQLVIFGRASNRALLYRKSRSDIEALCQQLDINQIIDIGEPTGLAFGTSKIPVIETGRLQPLEISQILKKSMLGWLQYDLFFLEKSSVFAAYVSHGLVPVVQSIKRRPHYLPGTERFLLPQDVLHNQSLRLSNPLFQNVAHNAWLSYQDYRQSIQVKTFASLLGVSKIECI